MCIRTLIAVAAVGLAVVGLNTGCTYRGPVSPTQSQTHARPRPAQNIVEHGRVVLPTIQSINREPRMRVRIQRNAPRVQMSGGEALLIGPITETGQPGPTKRFTRAVAVTYFRGAFLITDTRQQTVRWALKTLRVASVSGSPINFNGRSYPGEVVLVPVKDQQGKPTGKIDVVNHVPMESYLPGVIERELYGSWEEQVFRAAAIAARSYAIFESSLNRHKHYDLESTTASQAYGGQARNPKALDAVKQTRGQLLEYNGRIVPAFYSSSCGGTGQDAKAAFTWLPTLPDMPPLRGRSHGGWCQGSDKFRWGPINRSKATLAQRIKSWGLAEDHPVKRLRGIRDIRVHKTNSVGRPTAFSISDMAGMTYLLGSEQFRFACNASAPGIAKPGKGFALYSSHVSVKTSPTTVTFYDGRGFGHGVGLCQFGAQGLAKSGYNAYSILNFYYPGAKVVQAY